MTPGLRYALAMFSLFPAVIGMIKYKRVNSLFYPFIWMMFLVVFVENLNYLGVKIRVLNSILPIAENSYMLFNFFLFLKFITNFKYLSNKKAAILFGLTIIIGIGNCIYSKTLLTAFYYLLCFVSIMMLLIAINILTRQIMEVKQRLVKNFWFWFCATSVLYNAYTLLVFAPYFFALENTPTGKTLGYIQDFVDAGCYILYGITILKIPKISGYIKNRL